MLSVVQSPHYEHVLEELNYSFADIYIFDRFIISEIKEGINFSWEHHAKFIVKDISKILSTDGSEIVYISHRINSYSVVPMGWLSFFKNGLSLKAYGVVGYSKSSFVNTVIEGLFYNKKIKRFNTLDSAIHWAKNTETLTYKN